MKLLISILASRVGRDYPVAPGNSITFISILASRVGRDSEESP